MTDPRSHETRASDGPTVVISQPTYLPWIGYFEQIARADVVVFLDSVQFEPRSWQCRNRLRSVRGEPFWLSVPVAAHARDTTIRDIRIAGDQPAWRATHLSSISVSLGRAPFFEEVFPHLETWLTCDHEMLADLNVDGIRRLAESLDLAPEWKTSSQLPVDSAKGDLILDICRHLGAAVYYTGAGSRAYLEPLVTRFEDAGVEVVFQDWVHPTYPQRGEGFVSHLSVADALMNVGPVAVRDMLKGA
jgi:hypothetical protein